MKRKVKEEKTLERESTKIETLSLFWKIINQKRKKEIYVDPTTKRNPGNGVKPTDFV